MTQQDRPVFLNLTQIRLPLNALVSILHRVSGLFMFLTLPWVYCWLDKSLASAQGFRMVQDSWSSVPMRVFLTLVVFAWIYHALAGVRHLIMDFGYAESLTASRVLSWLVLLVFTGVAIYVGAYLWLPM